MGTIACRKCGADAAYSHSDRRGDVHICNKCDARTVYPVHTDSDPDHVTADIK